MNWKSVRNGEDKKFCTGPIKAAKAGQKSFERGQRAQRANQGRTPFICTPWVPMCLSFNSKQGPHLSSLFEIRYSSRFGTSTWILIELGIPFSCLYSIILFFQRIFFECQRNFLLGAEETGKGWKSLGLFYYQYWRFYCMIWLHLQPPASCIDRYLSLHRERKN